MEHLGGTRRRVVGLKGYFQPCQGRLQAIVGLLGLPRPLQANWGFRGVEKPSPDRARDRAGWGGWERGNGRENVRGNGVREWVWKWLWKWLWKWAWKWAWIFFLIDFRLNYY